MQPALRTAVSRSRLVLGALALVALAAAPASADKCTGAKLKAIGKKEAGLLGCQSKVAATNDPSGLAACALKVSGKFSAAFAKAGSCTGDEITCENQADACETNVATAMTDAFPSRCEAAKRKAAGKLAHGELGCSAKAAATGLAVESGCIAKATGKFSAALGKAGTCPDSGSPQSVLESNCVAAAVTTDGGGVVTVGCSSGTGFTKITTGDIVTIPANYWNGSWGDYDDDGWLDLFVGTSFASKRNYLYHNNRDGTFALIDDSRMPKSPSNQHGAAWGDYDNDGHLDLIVTAGNPGVFHNALYRNNGDGTFSSVATDPIYAQTFPDGFHGPSWADYDNDGFIDLLIVGHDVFSHLFRNNGDGSFARITTGVLATHPNFANQGTWVDYDNDGDLDLFVDSVFPNTRLYRNEGNGVFTVVAGQLDGPLDTAVSRFGTGPFAGCWADYDNDGFPDVFIASVAKNFLYHNNGDSTFTNIADSAVVQDTIPVEAIFASCAWGDYDNDGFIDLFVTVGDGYGGAARTHNLLYHNNSDGTFTKVTEGPVVTDLTTQCPGASWGDYDNDGFLDLFVSQGPGTADPQTNLLYHNDSNSNAWLNVKLVGVVSNPSAIGAKVRVNALYRGESRWQLRDVSGGDGESNQQSLNAEFGLADATTIDTVRIEWPSGIVQELHDVAPRQFLTVTEPPPACVNDAHQRDFVPKPKPKLMLAKINTDTAARDDRLALVGQFHLPPTVSFSTLDPGTRGALLVLRNRAGGIEIVAHLPPGVSGRTRGWQGDAAGTRWTYFDKTARPIQGVVKVVAVDRGEGVPGGAVKVSVVGRRGNYPVIAGDEPVQATVVLGDPAAAALGICGESDFSSSDCAFNSSGTTLTCRK